MSRTFLPTTQQIKECFVQDLDQVGGTIIDNYDDGQRLILRSVLPLRCEVRPGDQLQAGIALKAGDSEIVVHPYIFRQVCRNGAIIAQAVETRRLERFKAPAGEEEVAATLAELHEALVSCSTEEAFVTATDPIRAATMREADLTVMTIAFLAHYPPHTRKYVIDQITGRYSTDGDRSQFGLMNAVTSLARDTPDPQLRWRLEELGGAIGAMLLPLPEGDDRGAALSLRA
jgi:hypothetical protein